MNLLYTVNPRRRKRKSAARSGRRKHRSAAQRAATRRMLAANRASRGGAVAVMGKRRRRRSRAFRRNPGTAVARRYGGGGSLFAGVSTAGVTGLLKSGAVMGGGAVAVDIGMGYASKVLPETMVSPVNTDGSANWGYFGAKTALALAVGIFGRRLPVIGRYAPQMAEGALSVIAYQLLRPMVPASIAMGYLNPVPTMRPRRMQGVGRTGKYVSGAGAYFPQSVRGGNGVGRGASAAQVVNLIARRDRSGVAVAGR